MPEPAVPHPAATIVLAREAGTDFEVLLLRRHADLAFLAGAHVFPGGRIDPFDHDDHDDPDDPDDPDEEREPAPGRRIPGLEDAAERAVRVAAARELLEEAGVLLARRGGRWATAAEAAELRSRIEGGTPLARVLADDGWALATEAMIPFGRIVTPRSQPRRFDTHFLLALLPPGQEATPDGGESDDVAWVEPRRAIAEDAGGSLALAPPTWFTLALLAQHVSLAALLAWAGEREIVRIEPRLSTSDDRRTVTFPNEPLLDAWHGPDGIVFDLPSGVWRPPLRAWRGERPHSGSHLPSNPYGS